MHPCTPRYGRRSIRWEEAFYYSCCDAPTRHDPCPGGFVADCKTSKDTIVQHWRAGQTWSGELVKLTTSHGYDMISSAGWYLPGNASIMYVERGGGRAENGLYESIHERAHTSTPQPPPLINVKDLSGYNLGKNHVPIGTHIPMYSCTHVLICSCAHVSDPTLRIENT